MKALTLAVAALAAALASPSLHAQDFPSRPITFNNPFGPGSASDTLCRIIGDALGTVLKQPIVVEDRPGADGAVAAQYVARATPDGYNLMMATNSPLSADPFLLKGIAYDPIKDFEPVTRVGSFTLMLVVTPSLPVHSVKELLDYAKANPGKLSMASGNTAGVVGAKTLAHFADIDVLHVPYKSSPQAIEDVIAGRVSMMIVDFTVGMPHVSSGQVRALAMTRLKRSKLYPDLPTMDEAGVKGFELDAWAGARCAGQDAARCDRKTQRRAAQGDRQSGHADQVQECRVRRVIEHAGRIWRIHQDSARCLVEDGEGRQHSGGIN